MAIKKIDSFNKHQNPSTNQNPFDIEKYLNVNWDKTQEAINNNADELKTAQNNISEIKQEQITQNTDIENIKKSNEEKAKEIDSLQEELEQTKTNLENYAIHGKSTGEYIHLTDSSETDCRVDVRGNSRQETSTQGKNKIDLREATYKVSEVNVIKNNSILTLNGKMNIPENLLDTVGDMYKFIYLGKFKAGTYRFSKFIISGKYSVDNNIGVGTFACYIRKKDKTLLGEIGGRDSGGTGVTITLQEDTDLYMQIFCNAGAIFDNCVLGFQLEEGDKTTDFEQFIPNMPSPEDPSKVETVGSNKNIFDKDNVNNIINALISNKGQIQSSSERRITYLKVKKGTYTITKHKGTNSLIVGYTKTEPKIGDTVENFINVANKNIATITIEDGYLVAYIFTSTDFSENQIPEDILEGLKIEQGEVSTSYSTYEQGSVKVTSCNKNLFDVGENNYSTMGLNITLDKSRIKINGTPTSNNYILKKDNINGICLGKFKKGTYHITRQQFSGFTKKGNGFSVQIRKDAYDGTTLVSYGMETILQQKKFVLNEDVDLYLTMWANKDDIYNDVEFLFSIYSDNDVNYVQHEEQSYIMLIQAEMLEGDDFDKVNKKEVHNWGKVILDGSQTIEILGTEKTGIYRFAVTINGIKTGNFNVAETINNLISDKLIVGSNNDTYQAKKDNIMHMRVNNKPQVIIYIEKCAKMTVDEFANFLSENNIELYYKLAEPKKLDLTQEQIQALEKLDKLKTYKNITNITTDSIAILDVDYKKDLETWQNQQDDRIKALEELVSTTQTSAMLIENLENDLLKEV